MHLLTLRKMHNLSLFKILIPCAYAVLHKGHAFELSDVQATGLKHALTSTPNSTTRKPPAELLLNRKIRTRLQEESSQEQSPSHLVLQQRDDEAKTKMKAFADEKSRAKESTTKVGDTVLVRQAKENKLPKN